MQIHKLIHGLFLTTQYFMLPNFYKFNFYCESSPLYTCKCGILISNINFLWFRSFCKNDYQSQSKLNEEVQNHEPIVTVDQQHLFVSGNKIGKIFRISRSRNYCGDEFQLLMQMKSHNYRITSRARPSYPWNDNKSNYIHSWKLEVNKISIAWIN